MTNPHDTRPHPHDDTHDDVAALHLAIPGDRRPSICRVAATGDGNLSLQLARLILDTHTGVGDVVLDIDDDVAFGAAAARAGRRHHALGGAQHLATMGHAAGYIDMVLLHWPRPAVNPRLLLIACRSLLRNAGVLVIAVSVELDHRVSHLSALGGAATTAELHLIDHIAAVDSDTAAATRVAAPRRAVRGQGIAASTAEVPRVPVPHTDLMIFSPARGA
jgi:hypothetical protein